MFKFLFSRSKPGPSEQTKSKPKDPPSVVAAVSKAPPSPPVPDISSLSDGDPVIVSVALSAGPADAALRALDRVTAPADLAKIAIEARLADVRHAAARTLTDEALLESVAQKSKASDKRVYKVARDKVDGMVRERRRRDEQARLLTLAEALGAEPKPDVTRAVELERAWAALPPDADSDARFGAARAAWQRNFQELAEARRRPPPAATGAPDGVGASPAPDEPGIAAASTPESSTRTEPPGAPLDATSLPSVEDSAGVGVPEPPASLVAGQPDGAAPPPASSQDGHERRARPKRGETDPELKKVIARELEALEQSLESGRLHDAESKLAELSQLQSRAGGVAGGLGDRIRRAAEEISRLRAWRRWGGRQSREVLVQTAEALVPVDLPPEERGRAVKALREQWQELNHTEGTAPASLRERFDAACEKAWEPVRAHMAEQAERRAANQARRVAFLERMEEQVKSLQAPTVDWRSIAQTVAEAPARWRKFGHVGRDAKQALEARFEAALAELDRRLKAVAAFEEREREGLISRAQFVASKPDDKELVARIRALQSDWQQRTRTVPLDRDREQALWTRFSAVCDTVFASLDAARTAERAEADARDRAEAERWQKRQEEWRALREVASSVAEAEAALVSADPAVGPSPEVASRAKEALERWSALPPMNRRVATGLTARRDRALIALSDATEAGSYAAAVTDARARVEDELLHLEIALRIDSPPEFKESRTKLQLKLLADAMRSGGEAAADALVDRALALLELPCANPLDARRLDAILERLAPQRPVLRSSDAGPKERGGRREGRPRDDTRRKDDRPRTQDRGGRR